MRTVLRVLIGLTAACLIAAVLKVGHVITPGELSKLTGNALTARLWRFGELSLLTATHQSLFTVPLALIAVTVCEINRFRGWLTYAAIGLAIALAGLYLQYVGENGARTIINPYAIQAFAVEGVCAGLLYWLIAGRFAGYRRGGALVRTRPLPLARTRAPVSDVPLSEGKPAQRTKTETANSDPAP